MIESKKILENIFLQHNILRLSDKYINYVDIANALTIYMDKADFCIAFKILPKQYD